MNWAPTFNRIKPYIVSVETPYGSGTAFLFAYNETKQIVGFATAAHVVAQADDWKLPIKLTNFATRKQLFVTDENRVIFPDIEEDSASILLFGNVDLGLPKDTLPLIEEDKSLPIGTEVGWVGFPSIAGSNLCFFTGRISSHMAHYNSYLIDGVAINGVSGGPVFYNSKDRAGKNTPKIIGTVSAYMPNRVGGDTLPGLLRAQDVTAFHDTINRIKSVDEARNQKAEQEKKEASKPSKSSSDD